MDAEEVFKSGSLYVPPQGFLKQKKSWHRRYYALYKASRQGIQRLEVFDTEDQFLKQNATKIIALTDCLKVAPAPQKQQSNVFEIRTKDSVHLLSADTFHEMSEWLNCLQLVAFGNHANGSVSNFDTNANQLNNNNVNANINSNTNSLGSVNSVNNLSDNCMQNEENLLYSSVDGPDIYWIKLIDTEASIRCGLKSGSEMKYTLIVTSVSITLAEDGKSLFAWPFRHIRRYGCTKEGFSLEAGRKCPSGDGLFSFITKDGNLIFQAVATHVNSLKASRNLTDDPLSYAMNTLNSVGSNNTQTQHNESFSNQNHSYFNNETRPLHPQSVSPPIITSKPPYYGANSIPYPNKGPEPSKRHSIQPPKSPQMVPKTPLTRVTSATTATTTVSYNTMATGEIKPKPSPPISKPPRKSKESKGAIDADEPVFASREEIFGLSPEATHIEVTGNSRNDNYEDDDILYDEPGEVINQSSGNKDDRSNAKTPFCPSPPPVTHTVSKLTSVLKMMFSGNLNNQVSQKYSFKDKRPQSPRSSSSSSGTGSVSSPIVSSPHEKIDPTKDELAYAHVCVMDIIAKPEGHNQTNTTASSNKTKPIDSHYAKINNISNYPSAPAPFNDNQDNEDHDYVNIPSHSESPLNVSTEFAEPRHYIQNDCEYARVLKRPLNSVTKN